MACTAAGVIRVGAKAPGNLDYVASRASPAACARTGQLQGLVMLGGSQREVGLIFPADAIRQVFLGTLVLPATRAGRCNMAQDKTRDVAGYVERIGPRRWRLVMPGPHFEFPARRHGAGPVAGGMR